VKAVSCLCEEQEERWRPNKREAAIYSISKEQARSGQTCRAVVIQRGPPSWTPMSVLTSQRFPNRWC
jgi:hypothetical protein